MGVRTYDCSCISGDAGPAVRIEGEGGVVGVSGSEMIDCHGGHGSRPCVLTGAWGWRWWLHVIDLSK
jgi:hypothetical protein